jgi:copper transport protein
MLRILHMSRIEDLTVAGWRRSHPAELSARIAAGLGVLLLSPTVLTAASRSRPEPSAPEPKAARSPRAAGTDVRLRIAVTVSGLVAAASLVYTAPGTPWARADVLAPAADTGSAPAAAIPEMTHATTTYSGVIRTADRTILVDAVPATVGSNTVAITVLDAKGAPAKVQQWSATASLPGAGIPDVAVPLKGFGEGVAAADPELPVAGKWTFTVTIRVAGASPTSFTHVVPIGPSAPPTP